MDLKKVVALAIAAALLGVLIGYLVWGQRTATLINELAELKARLVEQTEQAETRQRETEAKLKQAESKLKQAMEDLALERQRRQKLEQILSEGRK